MSFLEKDRVWEKKPLLGILLMLFGLALYPLSDALIKHLLKTYPLSQICFLRGATRLIPLFLFVFLQGGVRSVFHTKQKTLHWVRLGVSLAYTYIFMLCFSLCSLTTVYTLGYTSSLFMIILGGAFLKERVGIDKWGAVLLGLVGIAIALKPTFSILAASSLIVLLGTLLGALNKNLMRKLTQTEHSLAIAIYPNILMVAASFPLVIRSWHPLTLQDWILFGCVGLITAGAQLCVTQALRFAETSSLAPVDYSSFIWVLLLDFIYFGELPDLFTLVGAGLIIAANLYILYLARREEKTKPLEVPYDNNDASS